MAVLLTCHMVTGSGRGNLCAEAGAQGHKCAGRTGGAIEKRFFTDYLELPAHYQNLSNSRSAHRSARDAGGGMERFSQKAAM